MWEFKRRTAPIGIYLREPAGPWPQKVFPWKITKEGPSSGEGETVKFQARGVLNWVGASIPPSTRFPEPNLRRQKK